MKKPLPQFRIASKKNRKTAVYIRWGIFFFIFLPSFLWGNEFKVLSFKEVPNDISAIQNRYKRYDDNDMLCAIVKVRSDVPNLRFSASNPVVGNVERRQGEYWVYLSAGTRQLYVFTEGFIKLSYTFPLRIEKGTVYLLEITSVNPLGIETGKGSLEISSQPDSVAVSIDGFPDLKKWTPCSFHNYRSGSYKFIFQKYRYQTLDTVLHINRKETTSVFIRLKPKWGNLIVASLDNIPYTFQINGKKYEAKRLELMGDSLGLDVGDYTLRVSRQNYYDTVLQVHLTPGDTTLIVLGLKPVLAPLRVITQPPGAAVYLDGIAIGRTPLQQKVMTGKHHVRIVLNDFVDENREVEVVKGQETLLDLVLQKHAPVRIESEPEGAEVWINGELKGETPLNIEMRPGNNILILKKPFFLDFIDTLRITGAKVFRFRLPQKKYRLKVGTRPSGAAVYVNGRNKGASPASIPLTHGHYRVHVEKRGYVSRSKSVSLKQDKEVDFVLRRRLQGYVAGVMVVPTVEYQMVKWGGEIGWTYPDMPFLMTALGYVYGYRDNLEDDLPDVKSINPEFYNGLSVHDLSTDGFAEGTVNIFYVKAGLVIPKPFTMVITGTLGYYGQRGYEIYVSDGYYSATFQPDLVPGDKFRDSMAEESRGTPIFGFGYQMKLSSFFLYGDYWISNRINNRGSRFVFGFGLSF